MLQNVSCQTLCLSTVPKDDAAFINQLIKEDYGYNFLVDGLPAAEIKREERTGDKFYDVGGVNLGDDETNPDVPALNNHFDIFLECARPARPTAEHPRAEN
jgi:transmembrane 9 superfamily protein 2/4